MIGPLEVPSYSLAKFPKASEPEPEAFNAEPDFDTADDDQAFAGYSQDGTGQDDELQRTIKDGGGTRHGPSRSENVFYVVCELIRRGKSDDEIVAVLLDKKNGISAHVHDQGNPAKYARDQVAKARKKGAKAKKQAGGVDIGDPRKVAKALLAARYTKDGRRTLQRHRGTFWEWTGTYYKEHTDEYQRSVIWKFLPEHSRANRAIVGNVLEALNALCQLHSNLEPPFWIADKDAPTASEFFACANGLLHLPSKTLYPPTPDYFGLCASTVIYDENAPTPKAWMHFIGQALDNDKQTIQAAQEWSGYCLSPDTSQQKILFAVGQKRTGKGTFARVLTRLLGGPAMVGGPTLKQLAGEFGLWPLITKPLAIITDAEGKQFKSEVVAILKSISGEDNITINRKNLTMWTGKMMVRFMILGNQLPVYDDVSGALAGRYIVIKFPNSFYGNEDTELTDKLVAELPGILNWALAGYQSLRERGKFVQPEKSKADIQHIEDMGSPVNAFIRDCCELGPHKQVPVDDIYTQYLAWRDREGHQHNPTKNTFGAALHAIVPGFHKSRPRDGGERVQTYYGIALRADLPPLEPGPEAGTDAFDQVKVDLIWIYDNSLNPKAKGDLATKYGHPETRKIIWLPNAKHARDGAEETLTHVTVGGALWAQKQKEWKAPSERDVEAMDTAAPPRARPMSPEELAKEEAAAPRRAKARAEKEAKQRADRRDFELVNGMHGLHREMVLAAGRPPYERPSEVFSDRYKTLVLDLQGNPEHNDLFMGSGLFLSNKGRERMKAALKETFEGENAPKDDDDTIPF